MQKFTGKMLDAPATISITVRTPSVWPHCLGNEGSNKPMDQRTNVSTAQFSMKERNNESMNPWDDESISQ